METTVDYFDKDVKNSLGLVSRSDTLRESALLFYMLLCASASVKHCAIYILCILVVHVAAAGPLAAPLRPQAPSYLWHSEIPLSQLDPFIYFNVVSTSTLPYSEFAQWSAWPIPWPYSFGPRDL